MSNQNCFFTKDRLATGEVDYLGYYGSDPHTKAYRGIIGLSIANFDVVEEHIYVPRSSYARNIHIVSSILKIIVFISLLYFIDLYWFWKVVLAFLGSISIGFLINLFFNTVPRSFYLFNLSSVVDFAAIIILPLFAIVFLPDTLDWMATLSIIILLFINSFTWKLKKYHLYAYPDKLYSMYEVGFRHGAHPQLDNYLGFLIKPLRWFF